MSPILHHYPPSLFSEKIRVLLGYLNLEWRSVIIPPIMPRPHLMPLSGGYRKTPIMQIGANVFCDSQIIARRLADLAQDRTLFESGFAAERAAQWADSELFRIVVALNFRPDALAAQMGQVGDMDAFQKDRAELSDGAPIVSIPPDTAMAHFQAYLVSLNASLRDPFLFGAAPSIADFSVYHCLWFVAGNPANKGFFDGYPEVQAYMERVAAFGHGTFAEFDAEQALAEGASATPDMPAADVDRRIAGELRAGDAVAVSATDYGRNPILGELVRYTADEIAIARSDDQAGDVVVHFPSIGFAVSRSA